MTLIKEQPLSNLELTILSETFRLLGDPSRLRILLYCENGPKSVTDIADALELSQSLVSHHLRLLRGARLVSGVRHAKQVFYKITDNHVSDLLRGTIHHVREEHAVHHGPH